MPRESSGRAELIKASRFSVADQPRLGTRVPGDVDARDWMRRGALVTGMDTMAVANRNDFAALTVSSRADGVSPFLLAALKLA